MKNLSSRLPIDASATGGGGLLRLLAGTALSCSVCFVPALLHAAPAFETLYTFSYVGDGNQPLQLAEAGGTLYGIASTGAGSGVGGLFSFEPNRRKETVLVNFGRGNAGAQPDTLNHYGKNLFVSTVNGITYKFNTASGRGTTIYDWRQSGDGAYSDALLKLGNNLYGTAPLAGGGGVRADLFQLDLVTKQVKGLFVFNGGPEGGAPNGQLIYNNGVLYGALAVYNSNNYGGVFGYDLTTGKEKVVATLNGTNGAQATGLIACGQRIYGVAYQGGANGAGTVFRFDPATDKLSTIYNFRQGTDAQYPFFPPICFNGALYGTSFSGGANGYGAIYELNPQTGQETVLHSFDGTDGAYPLDELLPVGNVLYGTTTEATQNGGLAYTGTLFRFKP